ncbi:hypothetical protein [Nocardia farcinica]|uniref:hypothetical protein n=1 Tax=Nocardia farcinica TaxID=37329 RepID=UPI001E335F6A|nr:hypothetical protein [Nocardia farcinica]MCZ9330115.1 hypothetical protein [Nocardia farcinica]
MRQDLLAVNPMDRVDTITVPKTLPRPATAADIAKVFAAICPRRPSKEVPVEVLSTSTSCATPTPPNSSPPA